MPSPERPLHLRPVDGRQPRPRSVRRCRPARRSTRSRRSSKLAEVGAYGVSTSTTTTSCPFERIGGRARPDRHATSAHALADTGMKRADGDDQPLHPPVFKDGAFTANDPAVRGFALQKTMRAIDLGAELGARDLRLLGRPRRRRIACRQEPRRDAIKRFREALNFLCEYVARPGLRPPVRARAQAERAARRHLPADRRPRARASSPRSITPRWSASTPRSRTRRWPGLNFLHAVGAGAGAGKLFHIDLNEPAVRPLRPGLPLRRSSLKQAFFLVKLLEDVGYDGPRHFDAHALPHRRRRGRLGLRPRLHAHLPDPRREGARSSTPTPGRRSARRRPASRRSASRPSPAGTAPTRCARCGRRRSTSTRSAPAATRTSGSTNWSSSTCSGCRWRSRPSRTGAGRSSHATSGSRT